MGVVVHIKVGLKEFVPGHIGNQQVAVIKYSDEAGLATFGRGVASALAIAGGHYEEGGFGNESFDGLSQVTFDLCPYPLDGSPKGLGEPVIEGHFAIFHVILLIASSAAEFANLTSH